MARLCGQFTGLTYHTGMLCPVLFQRQASRAAFLMGSFDKFLLPFKLMMLSNKTC
jgi:hypothetical protein